VYEDLVSEILSGAYRARSRLQEENLAAQLGSVGYRNARPCCAFRRLAWMSSCNRAAQVAQWSDAAIDDIFELRTLLEGHGVRKAAERGVMSWPTLKRFATHTARRKPLRDLREPDSLAAPGAYQ
jgi:DNA-binding GntR family transcriptional regulator